MSAISDFNKVWVQKFPGSQLPSAWEEDVKTNLSKHKQRVSELQEELEKEQIYVQFLESLLEEVEKRKIDPNETAGDGNRNSNSGQENDINDVIKDTLERRCLAAQENSSGIGIVPTINEDDPMVEEPSQNRDMMANSSSQTEDCKTDDERQDEAGSFDQDLSADEHTEDIQDHFVTVIEVNGLEKEKSTAALPSNYKNSSRVTNEDVKRLKKIPPRPPPKSFKLIGQESNNWTERRSSGPLNDSTGNIEKEDLSKHPIQQSVIGSSKLKAERPIIFDSRKKSVDNGLSPVSSIGNTSHTQPSVLSATGSGSSGSGPGLLFQKPQYLSRSAASRKFEGSKQPLPAPIIQNDLDNKIIKPIKSLKPNLASDLSTFSHSSNHQQYPIERENSSKSRSKILDLVNKMESNNKPATPCKNIEQLTPRTGSSFKKTFQGPIYQVTPAEPEPAVSDYIDPCDAEFELINDQIYDSPPPEPEFLFSSEKGKRNSNIGTMESQVSGNHPEFVNDPDDEPMYDTVAPDQEDDPDYVLLMEETSCSASNSLKKNDQLAFNSGNFHSESALPSSNNDIATIKSQTSVISGQSAATTSSGTSDTDGIAGSPLPHDGAAELMHKNSSANYVNIDYFLCKSTRKDSQASGESEDDETPLLRAISYDQDMEEDGDNTDSQISVFEIETCQYGGSTEGLSSFGNSTPLLSSRNTKSETPTMTVADQEKYAMFRFMLSNIAESEGAYVEVLNVMLQYMKALKATLSTSKPVMSTDEFNVIFYKIPELYELHQKFLIGLQQKTPVKRSVGKHFEHLAQEIGVYGAFLQNYSRAVDTVRKCSQNNSYFGEITRNIRLRSLNKNQAVSLETLLYSPVSRIQKNIEIIQDLLKCLPITHPDHVSLKSALREFQSFLSGFKMIQPEELFQGQDRSPRHLVKNSFIVELSEGHRKLRHIFLFNDVLVCAKYKASGKSDKFTFELKWYIPVAECIVVEESCEPRESTPVNLVALRSQASTVRDQIKRQTSRDDPKKTKADKQRKKLAELEAQLVLASPNLVFKVKAGNGRSYTFFLSSEFERSQWVDAIDALKASRPSSSPHLSMSELQNWLTSCRKHLKTNMGSYLLRTGRDENLLVGDFYVLIDQLKGIQRAADLYICLEVDSYGHFFRKAKTKMICGSTQPCWNQDFTIELEGAQNLRILLYEDHPRQGTLIRAKTTIELNRTWLTGSMSEKKIELQDYVLTISTKFIPSEMTIRRVPTAKPSGLFGAKITQVCKREKRQVPFILTSCVREVERRGLNEVGIYRVSGSTSDVSRLKKAFETNSYEAEQLVKDVDIHSVTGSLKLYMRELPEALFTDELYPKFFEAFNLQDMELRRKTLIHYFSTLPPINQNIITFLLDHMVRVNKHENHNKMSLHNMATVFGPTLLRPGARNEGGGNTDLLAAGTVDVMAQAGILYFFLTRRSSEESMQPISS